MVAIAALTILSLFILLAMIAASLWIADVLERRRQHYYTQLSTFQQAMERIMNDEQPHA